MSLSPCFPAPLLSQPAADRLAYFRDKVIAHPALIEAYQKAWAILDEPAGVSLVFIFGPTGVGKSTLCRRLEQKIREQALAETLKPGCIPVVCVEAASPESGQFDWRDFYYRTLEACHEPLIDRKVDLVSRNPLRHQAIYRTRPNAAELCRALESCLRQREPVALIIDEANHLGKVTSGRRQLDQMDKLKSLANLTGRLLILAGTYDLLYLTNLNGQLSRRSADIEIPRYRLSHPDDERNFKGVLQTFAQHLPLPVTPDFVPHAEYLYERSLGCVGILKEWLVRSLADALANEMATVDRGCLDRNALSDFKLLRIANEIQAGEVLLAERNERMAEIRWALGLASPAPSGSGQAGTTKQRSERVGTRLPGRDPVGVKS